MDRAACCLDAQRQLASARAGLDCLFRTSGTLDSDKVVPF